MITSLLMAIFWFILSVIIFAKGGEFDKVYAFILFLLGLINLAVWVAEYVIDRIKKHIDEKLKK